ncbi:MAG: DMT family transporter [Novosphingobium sp.]|nr:DMT family transporter [Novosphingobium sp.]
MLALVLRLSAMVLLSTMFMLVKYAGQSGIALPELMFWRQAIPVLLIPAGLAFAGSLGRLRTQRLKHHALRAGIGMLGMVCGFGAAVLLPLAEAMTLGFTTPFFAVVISALILRERVGRWRWIAVAIGFVGVVIVAQPGGEPISPLGVAAGLASGFVVAIVSFQIKDLARFDSPIAVVFYFSLFGAVIMAVPLPFFIESHTAFEWLLLLSIGVFGTFGQWLVSASLRHGAVASVIVMDYTSLIWATAYGWLIWERFPPYTTWLGAPAIIAAGTIIAWREQRLARSITPSSAIEAD